MNENLPTNVQLESNGNGTVSFATDVIATIAGLAATEVEGVASMFGGSSGLADIFTRRGQAARSLTKGVKVELNESSVSIHLTIIVDYGSPVPEVAQNIQENVKKAIETMSGLTVAGVDVHVQGVSFERENRTAAEIEMQQRLMLQKEADENDEDKRAEAANEAEPERAEEPQSEADGGDAESAAGEEEEAESEEAETDDEEPGDAESDNGELEGDLLEDEPELEEAESDEDACGERDESCREADDCLEEVGQAEEDDGKAKGEGEPN